MSRQSSPRLLLLAAFVLLATSAHALPQPSTWHAARDLHFEVYSQISIENARLTLLFFEQLRSFFEQQRVIGLEFSAGSRPPVRIIEFSSEQEYAGFRSRVTADAYYVGTESRDYIVMPARGSRDMGIAAHEYAHLVLHADKLKVPLWLEEGLAEFFSTVHLVNGTYQFGGPLPARLATLQHGRWLALPNLLAVDKTALNRQTREAAAIFYSESWALTDMLATSPVYAPCFREALRKLSDGKISDITSAFCERPLADVEKDLQTWTSARRSTSAAFIAISPSPPQIEVSQLSSNQASALLADLLLANGELTRAEALYKSLATEMPHDPEAFAALGTIALRRGDRKAAQEHWREAIDNGLADPNLCYQYSVLAEESGLLDTEVRRALERAVALNASFDDARYKLALLESNAGNYEAAVKHLRSMRIITHARAFTYWSAMAYALTELGQREEAVRAATGAMHHAATEPDRARAAQLAYLAQTDLTVRFEKSADGTAHLVTTRIPHGTADFNPFIEAGDRIERLTGKLREVQCGGGKLVGFLVDTEKGTVTLDVPDPQHVLMRHAPAEFTCGSQPANTVSVEYAATAEAGAKRGVLRGMDFR